MVSSQLISLAGWYFLPNLVTGYLQTALYAIFIRAGDPKPTPGTPRYARDRRHLQIAVIVIYLLYTIYEADYSIQQAGDFYRLLGISPSADDRAIQSRFRRLTVQYHPDKATGSDRATIENLYVQLKLARDTLIDPAKRFAYDRLGPGILAWQNCKLIPDYILAALQHLTIYYISSACGLILLGVLGYLRQGMFWRYLVMAALFLLELHTLTRPHFPPVLSRFLNPIVTTTGLRNPYLPFQLIAFLRKLIVTFFIAMSQLGPLFADPKQELLSGGGQNVAPQLLDQIDNVAKSTDAELTRLMHMELTPFTTEQSAVKELKTSLKEWLVNNTIRNDPEVKAAINRTLERRRREGQEQTSVARS